MICDRCFRPMEEGEHGVYLCPLEPRRLAPTVWPDDIPGGLLIEHGLCHEDGTPRRFDSRSAIRAAAAARGLALWSDWHEESKTRDGREYLAHMKSDEYQRKRMDWREQRHERQKARARR